MNTRYCRLLKAALSTLAFAIACFLTGATQAQIPQTINYQGYLTNSASQPVNAAVSVTFRLYASAAGGSPVWQETQSGISVANGIFTAVLGSTAPFSLPFNVPYFLSLQVNTDTERAERQPLSAVPYALKAASADGLAQGELQGTGHGLSQQFHLSPVCLFPLDRSS